MKLEIKIDDETLIIKLNNTTLAKEIYDRLPEKAEMNRYDDREYYLPLTFKPEGKGEEIPDYSNGDIGYFPPLNTFAIFFDKAGVSSCQGLKKIGNVTNDYSFLKEKKDNIVVKIRKI